MVNVSQERMFQIKDSAFFGREEWQCAWGGGYSI